SSPEFRPRLSTWGLRYGPHTPNVRSAPAEPWRSSSPILLDRHVVRFDEFVAARFPVEPLGGAVEVELLIERHGGGVLDPELVDLVVLGQALLLVHDRLRLVEEAIELRIAVGREIVAGPEQGAIDRLCVHRRRPPAY